MTRPCAATSSGIPDPVMLQIVHLANNGGAEKHTRLITKAFARQGWKVIFIYPPGPYAAQFATLGDEGVECIEFDLKKNICSSVRFVRSVICARRVTHLHSHMHGADLIAALACLGLNNIRHFTTAHYVTTLFSTATFVTKCKYWLSSFIAFHLMRRIFAVSTDVQKTIRRQFLLSGHKVVLTLNSIDFEEMAVDPQLAATLRRQLYGTGQPKILLCAGLLCEHKGQKRLIEALHLMRPPRGTLVLVLLGEGEQRNELQELIERYDLKDFVVLPGFQPAIADWLSIADIYLQPSQTDAMPRSILEAMYMGVPVIASNIASLQDVVKPGITALTVNPDDPADIKRAIGQLMAHPDQARTLGEAGRDLVTRHCSMDIMATTILSSLG